MPNEPICILEYKESDKEDWTEKRQSPDCKSIEEQARALRRIYHKRGWKGAAVRVRRITE